MYHRDDVIIYVKWGGGAYRMLLNIVMHSKTFNICQAEWLLYESICFSNEMQICRDFTVLYSYSLFNGFSSGVCPMDTTTFFHAIGNNNSICNNSILLP